MFLIVLKVGPLTYNYSILMGKNYVEVHPRVPAWSCLTFCDPMDYSLPGSSVLGISQERIQEWVAVAFSRKY